MIINWFKTIFNYKIKYKDVRSDKRYEDIDFKMIEHLTSEFNYDDGAVDETTWHDLEMNKVFSKLNKTHTLLGEEQLYYWLKTPRLNEKAYEKRNQKLRLIQSFDQKIVKDLKKIGQLDINYRVELEKITEKTKLDKKPLTFMFSFFVMLSLYWILQSTVFLFASIGAVLAVILYHYYHIAMHKSALKSFDYIIKQSVFFSSNFSSVKEVYSDDYDLVVLGSVSDQLSQYKNKLNRLEGLDPIKDIGVALTLSMYWQYVKVTNLLFKYKNEVKEIAQIIGEIDCALAVNMYKEEKNTTQPILKNDMNTLMIKEGYNLLIENCVKNDCIIDDSLVITGSNMGGKSTYLRLVGINIILGQALCFSTAASHEGGFFNVVSSISLNDDIESGKSYFMKEAEAIHRMLAVKKSDYNTLFLIDEIFKGTNPVERLAASIEILNRLSKDHHVIVTTHDIGILAQLEGYKQYHFEHLITKTKMSFDYKLKEGVTEVKNAIKLMEYINYPKDVIESINNRMIINESIV